MFITTNADTAWACSSVGRALLKKQMVSLDVSGKQGAPCGRLMPVQSYRHGNHLHREASLLQPKRTRGVDCPVSLQRITPTTVRRAAWPKAGNIAELDPEGKP